MLQRVASYIVTDASEERIASIFTMNETNCAVIIRLCPKYEDTILQNFVKY